MFRLAYNEIPLSIRSKILTGSHRNERFLPYAFSESGIYMLMTVLKGPLAIKQSKTLIRTFKKMKDYIYEEKGFLPYQAIKEIEHKTLKHDEDIKEIRTDLDKVMDNFIDPSSYKEFLILNGNKLEADKSIFNNLTNFQKFIFINISF